MAVGIIISSNNDSSTKRMLMAGPTYVAIKS